MMGEFISEMLMLYCIGILGYIVRKMNILSKHTNDVLTQLILYITLPALILYSLDIPFSIRVIKEFTWLLLMSVYVLVFSSFIAIWLRKRARLPKTQASVYESLIVFGNQGFIGYAVCFILFAEQGIIYLTMFNLFYLIYIWTYGIYLFTKRKDTIKWKGIFLNPGILSTCLGMIILFTPLSFSETIATTLNSIGKMTIPLSMILIGSLLANITGKNIISLIKNRPLWIATLMRLIIIPCLLIPFALFKVPFILFFIAVLVAGMPAAPTTTLYAQKFGADTNFATAGVLFTTVLCIISIPLIYIAMHLFH